MKLQTALKNECIKTGLSLQSKQEVLEAITKLAKQSPVLADVKESKILEALKRREELGSTGFSNSIGIPHCRMREVKDFVVGMISVPDGVDFEAPSGEKVKLFAFIIGPESEGNEHLALLSEISHAFMKPGAVEDMLRASTAEDMREKLLAGSKRGPKEADTPQRSLFHVFVTDENKFRQILQVFAAMEASAISVVEGRQGSDYLAKIPLFAGFWSDKNLGICHNITALVEQDFTNETVRRIEQIARDGGWGDDVTLAVQKVFYSSGRLWS